MTTISPGRQIRMPVRRHFETSPGRQFRTSPGWSNSIFRGCPEDVEGRGTQDVLGTNISRLGKSEKKNFT